MPLHQSLADLSELAAHCQSPATARGLLAEAQDLLRNSLDHRADELELAAWFSRVITDIVRSPGVSSPVRLSGPAARGDALPSMVVTWLGDDSELESIISDAGLKGSSVAESTASRADAGLPLGAGSEAELLSAALDQRPPALRLVDGLPDRNAPVDVQAGLLAPIAAIARWAAPAPRPTPDRLAIGVERELLEASEAEALSLSWAQALHWSCAGGATASTVTVLSWEICRPWTAPPMVRHAELSPRFLSPSLNGTPDITQSPNN
ncbi:hypothetical protein [Corynebacterium striatum]|uniref:hypothetical protein n=1 Tax=Corynebacterium striatum TaxID=43770 RepID=UPI001F23F8A3|nr:hypothetical protein [Corynebacterium striatum]